MLDLLEELIVLLTTVWWLQKLERERERATEGETLSKQTSSAGVLCGHI